MRPGGSGQLAQGYPTTGRLVDKAYSCPCLAAPAGRPGQHSHQTMFTFELPLGPGVAHPSVVLLAVAGQQENWKQHT